MDRREILNSPPDKFLIPVSHINKPYVYVGNMVGLNYFLNILLSRLD